VSHSHDHGHDHAVLPPPTLEEVSDGIFAYVQLDGSWFLNNCGFVVGGDGVFAVDTTSTEKRNRAFLDSVRSVTDQPIRTLLNTHHHGDHTHGNGLTYPATIIGHRLCREEILKARHPSALEPVFGKVEWGEIYNSAPTLIVDDHLSVFVGDLEVELHYIGAPAHTTNDVVAWVPSRKVLFAGDLVFNGGMPFVVMGSVAGSLRAVERLRAFGAEVIVPGHGSVTTPAILDDLAEYYRFVQDLAAQGNAAGLTPIDTARQADLSRWTHLTDGERIVGNLHRAFAEADGAEPGAQIDIMAAIIDMVTYNHGKPLRCLA
jgi:cyclase